MSYFLQHDLQQTTLNQRVVRALSGDPAVDGKILYVSDDRHVTHGVWQSTPGVFEMVFQQDDSGYVLSGEAVAVLEDGTRLELNAGTLYTFKAGSRVRLEILSTWRKLFFNHYAGGTDLEAGY